MAETVPWWVGIAILQSDYEKADRIYQVHESFQPFTIAAETCIEIARKWQVNQHLDYLPLKYFFESGDGHWGQMSDRLKEKFGERPVSGKKEDPPLQAADFIAYEVRKAYHALLVDKTVWGSFRKSFLLWGQRPGIWGNLTDAGICTEMNLRGIPKRAKV